MGLPCIAVLSSIIAKSNLIKQLVTKTGVNWRKCKGKFAVDVFHLENSTNAIIHAHMLKKLVSKNRALMELKFYKKKLCIQMKHVLQKNLKLFPTDRYLLL